MRLISDGWVIDLIPLTWVTKRDRTHDLKYYPDHDGDWLRVDRPGGWLVGYVDTVPRLRQLLADYGGPPLSDFREAGDDNHG